MKDRTNLPRSRHQRHRGPSFICGQASPPPNSSLTFRLMPSRATPTASLISATPAPRANPTPSSSWTPARRPPWTRSRPWPGSGPRTPPCKPSSAPAPPTPPRTKWPANSAKAATGFSSKSPASPVKPARWPPTSRARHLHIIAAEEARRARDRSRQLFDNNPIPLYTCDHASLKFLDANEAALQLYGYPGEDPPWP